MNTIKICSVEYQILGGPCSHTLSDAWKYAYDEKIDGEHIAYFSIKSPTDLDPRFKGKDFTLWVKITSLQHEDGSGKSFNLEGFVSKRCPIESLKGKRFEAYYNTASIRHGFIRIHF